MDRFSALKAFTRVVEAGSFTRAADSLDMPNATLSKTIKQLEAHLGVSLLQRTTRRITVTPEGREIGIVGNQAVFSLIGQIQEETHRFAITYHHESHTKSAMKSSLDEIPGVGPKRRDALRKHFGTIKAIKAASVEELTAVLPRSAAEAVWNHFHP